MTTTTEKYMLHVYDAELSSINVFTYLGMTVLIGNI